MNSKFLFHLKELFYGIIDVVSTTNFYLHPNNNLIFILVHIFNDKNTFKILPTSHYNTFYLRTPDELCTSFTLRNPSTYFEETV